MKTFFNLLLAFVFLFNQGASFQTSASQAPQPQAQVQTDAPVLAQASSPWGAYPPPVVQPPAPRPSPTPAPIVEPVKEIPVLKISAEPAIYLPEKPIRLDWTVLGSKELLASGEASLLFHLPEGITPSDSSLAGLLIKNSLILPLKSAADSITWDISPKVSLPFTLSVELVQNGKTIDSNAIIIDAGQKEVVKGSDSLTSVSSANVSLSISDKAIDETLTFSIRNPSPNKLPPVSLTGRPVEIIAAGIKSGNNITKFNQPIDLTVRYEKEQLFDWSEADLQLFYYNEADMQWYPLETTVDLENHTLSAKTDHLTVFDFKASSWQGYVPPTMDTFQVSDFTGAGTYAMDFPTLPGTAGLKPSVSLTYNSQVVDEGSAYTQASWVGMGWSLELGSITRNMHETNSNTDDDTFYISANGISGLLLPVAVSGTVTTYTTADQSFVKVQYDNSSDPTNPNAKSWTVWSKDGTILQFKYAAKTSSNSGCAQNADQLNVIWQWSLSSVTDIHGNTILYNYVPETKPYPCLNVIAVYPDTILYANENYQVKFVTGSRTDYYTSWTAQASRTLYSTKRLNQIQLQKKNAGSWVNVRKYIFGYAPNTELNNVILPNFKWNGVDDRTLTLISLEEQNGDGSASLPATRFFYDVDKMHLNKVENGQGGKVELTYQRVSIFDDVNKTRFMTWDFGVDECNNNNNTGTSWTAYSGSVACYIGTVPWELALYGSSDVVAKHSFPEHIVKPGAEYRFYISGYSTGSTGTGTYWGFKDTELIRIGTPLAAPQIILNTSWTEAEGTLTMPATFNPTNTILWLENSGSRIDKLQVAQYITRYRVASRTVTDDVTGTAGTYLYAYDNFAYNSSDTSEAVTAPNANLYKKTMGEYRGHAMTQVTNPDGLLAINWYYQNDNYKGRSYRSFTMKQTFGDYLESINTDNWTALPADSSAVSSQVYPIESDKSVKLANTASNWNTYFKRDQYGLADGKSAILHFRLSKTTGQSPQGIVGIENSSGRFFGVLFDDANGVRLHYDTGSGSVIGSTVMSGANFNLDKWYVAVVLVDDNDGFRVRIWQLDQPENYNEAVVTGFPTGSSWKYYQKIYNGTLWLDAYSEGAIYAESESHYYSQLLYKMDGGGSGGSLYGPIMNATLKTFTDLSVVWSYTTETISRMYDGVATSPYRGDARWIGTRQTFEYASRDQFGNLIHTIYYRWNGTAWVLDHATGVEYYPRNDAAKYLVSLPARKIDIQCGSSCDFTGASGLLTETLFIYDTNSLYSSAPNGLGRLAKKRTLVNSPNEYSEVGYSYDTNGNIVGVTTYSGFATASTSPTTGGRTTTKTYDPTYFAYPLTETNALSQTVTTDYDYNLGLPTKVTDPNGAEEGAAYDTFGRMLAVCEPGDWDGYTCSQTIGTTLSITYTNYSASPQTPFNVLLKQKLDDTRFMQSLRYYNGLGKLLQAQSLGVQLWDGLQNTVIDYKYDANGRQIKQTQPYTYSTSMAFRPQTFTAAQGTSTTVYDILSRTISVTQADGTSQAMAYAMVYDGELGWGQQTSLTDAKGNTTNKLQDGWGRLVRVTPPTGPGVKYVYDLLGQLTDTYYGGGHSALTYNKAGQKSIMSDPDMGLWTYAYDALGNLTTQTDARLQRSCLYYDNLNRLIGKNFQTNTTACPTGTPSSFTIAYTFDGPSNGAGIGRRTHMVDPSGNTDWTYDPRGNVIKESKTVVDNSVTLGTYDTTWTYNSANQVVYMQYPGGDYALYQYHPQGSLNSVTSRWVDIVTSTSYYATGQVAARNLGNNLTTSYSYYGWEEIGSGQVKQVKTGSIDEKNYVYDRVGNILQISGSVSENRADNFGYDALNRLTSFSTTPNDVNVPAMAYTYSPDSGNLLAKTQTWPQETPPPGTALGYNPQWGFVHAVTSLNGIDNRFMYDANGNMTSRYYDGNTYALGYDAENRLVTVSGNSVATQYVYDGDGKRVLVKKANGSKTIYLGDYFEITVGTMTIPTPTMTGCPTGQSCIFLPLISTVPFNVPAGHTWQAYYFAGGQRVAVMKNWTTVASIPVIGETTWLLTDHIGSTSKSLNASGAVTGEKRYAPWGEDRLPAGTALPTQRLYTGQIKDDAGLYFYNARYYDPSLGRFIQPDSMVPQPGNPMAYDRYAYALNNPVRYNDPSGHQPLPRTPISNFDPDYSDSTNLILLLMQLPTNKGATVTTLYGAHNTMDSGNFENIVNGELTAEQKEKGYMTLDDYLKKYGVHVGVDLDDNQGNNVFAVLDGKVVDVLDSTSDGGIKIVIEHTLLSGKKVYSFYFHLQKNIYVYNGQDVEKGQIIGLMGTGFTR